MDKMELMEKINNLSVDEFVFLLETNCEDLEGFVNEFNINNDLDLDENLTVIEDFENFELKSLIEDFGFSYEVLLNDLEIYLSTDEYNELYNNLVYELENK